MKRIKILIYYVGWRLNICEGERVNSFGIVLRRLLHRKCTPTTYYKNGMPYCKCVHWGCETSLNYYKQNG